MADEIIQYMRGYVVPDRQRIAKRNQQRHPTKIVPARNGDLIDLEVKAAASPNQNPAYRDITDEIQAIGAPYEGWCLVLDTETTVDQEQWPRFGFWELHGISRSSRQRLYLMGQLDRRALDTLAEAGVFYNPLQLTAGEIGEIQAYAATQRLRCIPLADFRDYFYRWVYRHRALLIGANLPFDLGGLACSWGRGGGNMFRNAFIVKLCTCGYPQCFTHPAIRIKHLGHNESLIQFQHSRPPKDHASDEAQRYDGKFVDILTLGRALLGPGNISLKGLAETFGTVHQKIETDEHGRTITPEYLGYAQQDVTVTWEVYQAERELYRQHGRSTPLWKIYSEASIGKAYKKDFGITPMMERHPEFPPEVIGISNVAFYGARVEVKYRLCPIEDSYWDFKSQYPTINADMGLQRFELAHEIWVEEATEKIQDLLQNFHLEQLSGILSRQGVTSMGKPCRRILVSDRLNCHPHGLPECLLGAGTEPAQNGLDLGERLLDRREVRRVRR